MNARQRQFVAEYLVDLNATAAAQRIGYSARSAYEHGYRLLKNDDVKVAIAEALEARLEAAGVRAEAVLEALAGIAYSDIREVLTWEPAGARVRDAATLSERTARTIQSVKVKQRRIVEPGAGRGGEPTVWEVQEVEVRLWDKLKALDTLARYLGLLQPDIAVEDNSQTVNVLNVSAAIEGLDVAELRRLLGGDANA